MVAGAPQLTLGEEYIFFLLTSPSGLTQVIGLSQGLFRVEQDASGNTVVGRGAVSDLMLDRTGRVVGDQAVSMRLTELRTRIRGVRVSGK